MDVGVRARIMDKANRIKSGEIKQLQNWIATRADTDAMSGFTGSPRGLKATRDDSSFSGHCEPTLVGEAIQRTQGSSNKCRIRDNVHY